MTTGPRLSGGTADAAGVAFAGLACTIVCGPGAVAVTRLALSIYAGAGLRLPLCILTPRRCARELGLPAEANGIAVHFDEDVPGFEHIRTALMRLQAKGALGGRSVGWYLQQYLKLAHAWHGETPCFIHDGDTIFAPVLLQALAASPQLFTTREGTDSYNFAARAAGLPTETRSFVANGGLFHPKALQALHEDPAEWFLDVMDRGVQRSGGQGDFSEYQIMGALLKDRLPMRQIRMFRRFDLLCNPASSTASDRVQRALAHYDAIAFEAGHHSSAFKRWTSRLAYGLRYSW